MRRGCIQGCWPSLRPMRPKQDCLARPASGEDRKRIPLPTGRPCARLSRRHWPFMAHSLAARSPPSRGGTHKLAEGARAALLPERSRKAGRCVATVLPGENCGAKVFADDPTGDVLLPDTAGPRIRQAEVLPHPQAGPRPGTGLWAKRRASAACRPQGMWGKTTRPGDGMRHICSVVWFW